MFGKGITLAIFLLILALLGIMTTGAICFLADFGLKSLLAITPTLFDASLFLGLAGFGVAFLSLILLFLQSGKVNLDV